MDVREGTLVRGAYWGGEVMRGELGQVVEGGDVSEEEVGEKKREKKEKYCRGGEGSESKGGDAIDGMGGKGIEVRESGVRRR